jgi:Putative Ig domain
VTNTATNFNIHSTNSAYVLINPPAGMTISASGVITWTPSQTQSPGTNIITTVVTNTNPFDAVNPHLTATNSFAVVVREVNVAPILSVVPTQNVNELTLLTVTNTATNFNIHSTNSGYALISPPAGMTISVSGVVTWTPSQAQSPGTNIITLVVTNTNPFDAVNPHLTATNSFTVVVREVNIAPVLPVIPTQSVNELTLLTVTNTATNFNIHSTNSGYTLINPPAGMTISVGGVITWTPSQAQSPGTNTITTVVTNTNSFDAINPHLTATNSFSVVVREVNVAPVLPVIPIQSVNELTLLTVTNTASNFNVHSTNSSYVLINPPAGMTISASGIITWTPSQAQSPGTNTVTTVVTNTNPFDLVNPHLAATNSFTVIVFAPMLASIANFTVNVGQTVSFTATAKDNDNSRTLTFSLGTAPAGATINSASGLFNWRPPVASAGSSNNLSVRVTDNSVPSLSSTQAFYVIVNALTPVSLSPISHSATRFVLQVSGPIGPDYILQGAKSLSTVANTNWVNLLTNTPAASPFSVTDTNLSGFTNRFYRVQLGP